jgi:hypothetical protein
MARFHVEGITYAAEDVLRFWNIIETQFEVVLLQEVYTFPDKYGFERPYVAFVAIGPSNGDCDIYHAGVVRPMKSYEIFGDCSADYELLDKLSELLEVSPLA